MMRHFLFSLMCFTLSGGAQTINDSKHDYVDLGLPSGTLWATCNIGANSPEEIGDYYAWGETRGYKSGKKVFQEDTYKYYKEDKQRKINGYTKYVRQESADCWKYDGFYDNKLVLEASDDAATTNWGSGWRIPSKQERIEFKNKCTWTWTSIKGKNGYKVVGKNSKFIFLPASGIIDDEGYGDVNESGWYWINSLALYYDLYHDGTSGGNMISFTSKKLEFEDYNDRVFGQSIRPVRSK